MKKNIKYKILTIVGVILVFASFGGFLENEIGPAFLMILVGLFFAILGFIKLKKWGKIEKKEVKKEEIHEKIEYERKCKSCGKIWHSLEERELEIQEKIKKAKSSLKTAGWGMLTGNWSALGSAQQTERNIHELEKDLDKLKSCPKCNSHNYSEKKIKIK